MTAPEKIVERLKAEPFCVSLHVKPDGDTLALPAPGFPGKLGKKWNGWSRSSARSYHVLPWIEESRQYIHCPGMAAASSPGYQHRRNAQRKGAPVRIALTIIWTMQDLAAELDQTSVFLGGGDGLRTDQELGVPGTSRWRGLYCRFPPTQATLNSPIQAPIAEDRSELIQIGVSRLKN